MDGAYISALSALAGSAVGAFSSFATTWLTQNAKYKQDQRDKALERCEKIYSEFINDAAEAFADAIGHELEDPANLVKIFSIVGRMRLFASEEIIKEAETVMSKIIATYKAPVRPFKDFSERDVSDVDLMGRFSDACRKDLSLLKPRASNG